MVWSPFFSAVVITWTFLTNLLVLNKCNITISFPVQFLTQSMPFPVPKDNHIIPAGIKSGISHILDESQIWNVFNFTSVLRIILQYTDRLFSLMSSSVSCLTHRLDVWLTVCHSFLFPFKLFIRVFRFPPHKNYAKTFGIKMYMSRYSTIGWEVPCWRVQCPTWEQILHLYKELQIQFPVHSTTLLSQHYLAEGSLSCAMYSSYLMESWLCL